MTERPVLTPRPDEAARATQIMLAEFAALRSEIHGRILLQTTITSLFATSAGAVAGLVVTHTAAAPILAIIPALSLVFHFQQMEQVRGVIRMGKYIGDELWPHLQKTTEVELPNWERYGVMIRRRESLASTFQ